MTQAPYIDPRNRSITPAQQALMDKYASGGKHKRNFFDACTIYTPKLGLNMGMDGSAGIENGRAFSQGFSLGFS